MTVLASGSKGNSTVISSSRTRVLVDAGLSCRELLRRMAVANEDPATLDAILITHEHLDHVAGLAVLARRLRIPVFFTEPTHRAWVRVLGPGGSDRLLVFAPSRSPPGEQRPARQHGFNDCLVPSHHARRHPVAHHRHLGAVLGAIP